MLPQPGQSLSEELVDLTADDVVVVMAFRRRPRIIRPLLQQLQSSGIPALLMCEPQAHGLFRWRAGSFARRWIAYRPTIATRRSIA